MLFLLEQKGGISLIIIVQLSPSSERNWFIGELKDRYKDKVKAATKYNNTVELINGDVIRIIPVNHQNTIDGIRADVAIGPDAPLLTLTSKQDKRTWGHIGELLDYIDNI